MTHLQIGFGPGGNTSSRDAHVGNANWIEALRFARHQLRQLIHNTYDVYTYKAQSQL